MEGRPDYTQPSSYLEKEKGRPDFSQPSSFDKRLKITNEGIIIMRLGVFDRDTNADKWEKGDFSFEAVANPIVV